MAPDRLLILVTAFIYCLAKYRILQHCDDTNGASESTTKIGTFLSFLRISGRSPLIVCKCVCGMFIAFAMGPTRSWVLSLPGTAVG